MDKHVAEFINDIVKPWNDFNEILSKPYAVQPDLSDFTSRVNNLSIAISHFYEKTEGKRKNKSLFNDIADTAKHGVLRVEERTTETKVGSCFLCNEEDKFCFLRNIPFINYVKNKDEEFDFMTESLKEIEAIFLNSGLKIKKELKIIEVLDGNFKDEASLKFNENYCVSAKSTNIRFYIKDIDGTLKSYDPSIVKFAVYR